MAQTRCVAHPSHLAILLNPILAVGVAVVDGHIALLAELVDHQLPQLIVLLITGQEVVQVTVPLQLVLVEAFKLSRLSHHALIAANLASHRNLILVNHKQTHRRLVSRVVSEEVLEYSYTCVITVGTSLIVIHHTIVWNKEHHIAYILTVSGLTVFIIHHKMMSSFNVRYIGTIMDNTKRLHINKFLIMISLCRRIVTHRRAKLLKHMSQHKVCVKRWIHILIMSCCLLIIPTTICI